MTRGRRAVAAAVACAAFLVAAGRARATPTVADPDLYRLHAEIDLPVIVGGTTLWAFPYLAANAQTDGPRCGVSSPCSLADVDFLDRNLTGTHYAAARWFADGAWAIPVAAFVVFDVADVGGRRWKTWLTDAVVIAEPVVIDGVLDEIFRRSIRRPRPFLYQDTSVYPDERAQPEATLSFYASDVSKMFSLASAISYTWSLRHPGSPARKWLFLGMYLLASSVAVARVLSGDSFVTDTVVGAVVGGSIGVAWPALRHWLYQREQTQLTLSVSPSPTGEGGFVATLGGRF